MTALKLNLNNEIVTWRMIWRLAEHNSYNLGYKEETGIGAEMQNRLVPHPCVMTEHQEKYLDCGGPPKRNKGPQPHTEASQPRVPVGGVILTKSGYENQLRFWPSGCERWLLEIQMSFYMTSAQTHSLIGTYPELWQKDSSRDIPETYKERLNCVAFGQGLEG